MDKVSNIKKAINCIDMLGSESMEPRHWEQLSLEIGQQIDVKTSTFAFKDMIQLEIQKYEAVV